MPYSFGRDITYCFYPLKEENLSDNFEDIALETTAPAIYVFDDYPDRALARAGTGALQTISSWNNAEDGKGKEFTISAIDDPEPTGDKTDYAYYLAINFNLQASEQQQTVIRLLPMRRVIGHGSTAYPTLQEVQDVYADVLTYFGEYKTERAIKNAVIEIKTELKAKGFEHCTIWNPDELKLCVAYKALSSLAASQTSGTGVWEDRRDRWDGQASTMLSSIKIEVDKDADGTPDEAKKAPNVISLLR